MANLIKFSTLISREILIWGVLLQSLVRINKLEIQICNLFSRELGSDSHSCQKDFVNRELFYMYCVGRTRGRAFYAIVLFSLPFLPSRY